MRLIEGPVAVDDRGDVSFVNGFRFEGSNVSTWFHALSGADPEQVLLCVKTVLALRGKWSPPPEDTVPNVSETMIKFVLGYRFPGF